MIRKPSRLGLLKVKAEEVNKEREIVKKQLPKKGTKAEQTQEYTKLAEERVLRITDGTSLVFSVSKTKEGNPHLDIRTHVHTEKYEGPTKRGINFNIEFLEDFRQILEIIDEELADKGL